MKFDTLKSNWRELLGILLTLGLLVVLALALGSREVAGGAPPEPLPEGYGEGRPYLALILTFLLGMVGNMLQFCLCLGMAWFGLRVTLPESAKVIFSRTFDTWWKGGTTQEHIRIGLVAAAVLALVAGLVSIN